MPMVRQPEVFDAQPGFVVSLLHKAISDLRGDYGSEAQTRVRGIDDQPAEYSPLMSAIPTVSLRHTRGNDLARLRMHDNEESFVEGVSQVMFQAVTRKSQLEEVLVCPLIVGSLLPEFISLREIRYADQAG